MKYAIYDKAADGYLTKMEFEVGYSEHTQFECGYNEYITEAQLLDTPKEATDVIVRIESFKFMEKGRFVMHSFDDTLKDQYIISEAGTPTKVVDNITVDLDGTINVKYGTMVSHWSASSLEYAITRMNALQKAKSPKYTAWCNTFDIYKVITIIDERSCTHYQFIKVTEKGLTEYAKDEVLVVEKEITDITESLNERIEELEKANYELGQTATARGVLVNRLRAARNAIAEVIFAIRNAIYNNDGDAFRCIENRMKFDVDFNSDPFMAGVSENIKDICAAEKKNIANHELKNSEISKLAKEITDWKRRFEEAIRDYTKCNEALGEWKKKCRAKDTDYEVLKNKLKACEIILESTQSSLTATIKERDKALERAENFKGIANSVYGITIPGRCCGKQITADVITGKKILIDKKKYDDLLECVNNISLTYEMMKIIPFSMDLPSWLGGIINRIEDLTK